VAKSLAVLVAVPEVSAKAIASAPIFLSCGGGQSWLVGKLPLMTESPDVQSRPSFGPPWHFCVIALQIGQGWIIVSQRAPSPWQPASVMQPTPGAEPPTHRPVSQVPPPQSPSASQSRPGVAPPRQRPVSLAQVPPPAQGEPTVAHAAPGVEPPSQRFLKRSPSR